MRLRSFLFLLTLFLWGAIVCAQQPTGNNDCNAHLELGRSYEISNDKRAEEEFKLALTDGGKSCPSAFLELSRHFSRNLRFREAADTLKNYIEKATHKDHAEDQREVKVLEEAAVVKERVENSVQPSLPDLGQFTKLADGYGRRKTYDALPFAEKAVSLYPESVESLLLLADLLRLIKTDNNRVEQLLNRAADIESNNPRVRSMRGWFYLFSLGRRMDAENEFRLALSLTNEKDPLAWKGLGYVLMFKGQKQQSIKAFRNYLKLAQSNEPDGGIGTLIEEMKQNEKPATRAYRSTKGPSGHDKKSLHCYLAA